MVTLTKTVVNTGNVFFHFTSFKKIFNCILNLVWFNSWGAFKEECDLIYRIDFKSPFKIFYCKVMITHVLIDHTSLNVNCFIVDHFLLYSSKLSKCFAKIVNSSKHKTLMKHRADEVFITNQRLSKQRNWMIY